MYYFPVLNWCPFIFLKSQFPYVRGPTSLEIDRPYYPLALSVYISKWSYVWKTPNKETISGFYPFWLMKDSSMFPFCILFSDLIILFGSILIGQMGLMEWILFESNPFHFGFIRNGFDEKSSFHFPSWPIKMFIVLFPSYPSLFILYYHFIFINYFICQFHLLLITNYSFNPICVFRWP